MKRIFLTLALLSIGLLVAAFVLGWTAGDPRSADESIRRSMSLHRLMSLGALIFTALVHAIMLTYFMGTGRWLEETSAAYRLGDQWSVANRELKYRTLPSMVFCLLLLIATGACGAAIDPSGTVGFRGWGVLTGATIHFYLGVTTVVVNGLVSGIEYQAISRNSTLIDSVMEQVQRIRREKGLPV
ncbi:MAG: hypothetical protein O3A00_18475 [Planctomycetota bacterium]|nr:hypothetical protein [Planctomycetota bacterium]